MKEQESSIMKSISTGYYTNGVSVLKYRMKFVNAGQSKRKINFEKGKKDNLTYTSRLYRHSYGRIHLYT